jgi:hypothetical protein
LKLPRDFPRRCRAVPCSAVRLASKG